MGSRYGEGKDVDLPDKHLEDPKKMLNMLRKIQFTCGNKVTQGSKGYPCDLMIIRPTGTGPDPDRSDIRGAKASHHGSWIMDQGSWIKD